MALQYGGRVVSYVEEEGIGELKNWLCIGKESRINVLSPETLFTILQLAFRTCHLNEALITIEQVKDVYPVVELAYHMLLSCAGTLVTDDYLNLKNKYLFEVCSRLADMLMY
ncbi:hypothetical protein CARUB_v10007949mg [Capsella rubella]|uniref:Uncharacterized protein n=1 Tax=Capsella rubella TaxID=81985 RepID=R0EU51_9BRAS|nr:hypothetical protein CARUB_v10007949mg [Capsella rubella]